MPLENGALVELTKSIYASIKRVGDQLADRVKSVEAQIVDVDKKLADVDKAVHEIANEPAVVIKGNDGKDGERGEKGDKGDPGERGERGEAGPQGEQGDQGIAGERGEVGLQGVKGDTGDAGVDGKDAEVDYAKVLDDTVPHVLSYLTDNKDMFKGISGDAGPQGEKGDPGVDGKDAEVDYIQVVERSVPSVIEFLTNNKEQFKGVAGPQGEQGEPGLDGKDAEVDYNKLAEVLDPHLDALSKEYTKSYIDTYLEAHPPENGEKGERGEKGDPGLDGKDAEIDYDHVAQDVKSVLEPQLESYIKSYIYDNPAPAGPQGERGEKGDPGIDGQNANVDYVKLAEELASTSIVHEMLAPRVDEYAKAYLELHQPENGIDGERGEAGERGERGEKGDPGRDGKDAEPLTQKQVIEALTAMPEVIEMFVQKYIAANPPRDGAAGPQGERGIDGINGKDGADGRDGKDGLSLVEAMIDSEGVLVHTFSDGTVKRLSRVVGKDGSEGEAGKDGRDGKDGANGLDGKDGAPGLNGKDGADGLHGKDGKDGINGTFGDDLNVVKDGRYTKWMKGDIEVGRTKSKEMLYQNVWKSEETYDEGDVVTWGGSMWHSNKDENTEKPGNGSDAWTLCAKRGNDGKMGPQGERGPQGPVGPIGPNRY